MNKSELMQLRSEGLIITDVKTLARLVKREIDSSNDREVDINYVCNELEKTKPTIYKYINSGKSLLIETKKGQRVKGRKKMFLRSSVEMEKQRLKRI